MIEAKKTLGQHWLEDDATVNRIVEISEINSTEIILEIGPGTGNLTKELLKKAKKVIAVEVDNSLLSHLTGRFLEEIENSQLELVNEDIRNFKFSILNEEYKLIANIPYYLTSYLIRLLAQSENKPEVSVLLIQKEVAERLTAKPGKMSVLSLVAQLYFNCEKDIVVPANLFNPVPKVDSQVVKLIKKTELTFKDINYDKLIRFINLGFTMKRKKLVNNLLRNYPKDKIISVFENLKINSNCRPQDLSLYDWYEIFINLA